jgi:hypothetical protein
MLDDPRRPVMLAGCVRAFSPTSAQSPGGDLCSDSELGMIVGCGLNRRSRSHVQRQPLIQINGLKEVDGETSLLMTIEAPFFLTF